MKFRNIFNLVFISFLALAIPVANAEGSNEAFEFCKIEEINDEIEHKSESENMDGSFGEFSYEFHYNGGDNEATFYKDGSFECECTACDENFTCGYGLSYNSEKTLKEIGHLYADFKVVKNNINHDIYHSFAGIHGWGRDSDNSLIEYYIIDTSPFGTSPGNWLGESFGDFEIDGAKYTIFKNVVEHGASIDGEDTTFTQIFCARNEPRECGTIDITAHFKKWEKIEDLNIKISKLHDAKVMLKANLDDGSIDIDFPYAKVYVKPNKRKCIIWNSKN